MRVKAASAQYTQIAEPLSEQRRVNDASKGKTKRRSARRPSKVALAAGLTILGVSASGCSSMLLIGASNTYYLQTSMSALNAQSANIEARTGNSSLATYFYNVMILQNIPVSEMSSLANTVISIYHADSGNNSYAAINSIPGRKPPNYYYATTLPNWLTPNTDSVRSSTNKAIANYYAVTTLSMGLNDTSRGETYTFSAGLRPRPIGDIADIAIASDRSMAGLPKGTTLQQAIKINTPITEKIIQDSALLFRKEGQNASSKIESLTNSKDQSAKDTSSTLADAVLRERIIGYGLIALEIAGAAVAVLAIRAVARSIVNPPKKKADSS